MSQRETRLTDRNGQVVEAFSIEMANLGFERMTEHILAMLDSGAWRTWKDGLGSVELQPGEFDYFLTICGVTREAIMHGIRDVGAKARLEQAMDERRTGEDGYRRRFEEVDQAVGSHRQPRPFGYSGSEAKTLLKAGIVDKPTRREALGASVRRFAVTGSTKAPTRQRSRLEQAQAMITRLDDDEFDNLEKWLTEHREQRRDADE